MAATKAIPVEKAKDEDRGVSESGRLALDDASIETVCDDDNWSGGSVNFTCTEVGLPNGVTYRAQCADSGVLHCVSTGAAGGGQEGACCLTFRGSP